MKIIGNTKTDDEIAFEILFRKFYVRLCGFANKFIANRAESEEIVEKIFLTIWEKRSSLKLNDEIRPYLFKSIQNLCFNYLEHQKIVSHYHLVIKEVYDHHPEECNSYDSVLYTELQAKIDHAIGKLPIHCRTIFQLNRQEGLKYHEIADKLGISVKTVETQMSRALAKLKKELNDYLTILTISIFLNI